jgi:hypothetical protein
MTSTERSRSARPCLVFPKGSGTDRPRPRHTADGAECRRGGVAVLPESVQLRLAGVVPPRRAWPAPGLRTWTHVAPRYASPSRRRGPLARSEGPATPQRRCSPRYIDDPGAAVRVMRVLWPLLRLRSRAYPRSTRPNGSRAAPAVAAAGLGAPTRAPAQRAQRGARGSSHSGADMPWPRALSKCT